MKNLNPKGVNCEPLVRYKKLCNDRNPDPDNPTALYRGIIDTWGIESFLEDMRLLRGNHEIWERVAQDRYVDKRIRSFLNNMLLHSPYQSHWINMLDFDDIVHIFSRGYALYTKCNVSREKWDLGRGAPECCLFNPYDDSGICDEMFECDDLTVAYRTARESVRKYIRLACTLCVLLEKFFGTKQSIERIENFMLSKFADLNHLRNNIVDVLGGHAAFKTIANVLKGVSAYIEALYRENMPKYAEYL